MERLRFLKDGVQLQILVCIILLIFLQHTSLVSSATSNYTAQTRYFISCGSTKNTSFNGRVFVKDSNSGSFRYSKKGSTALGISNQQSNVSELYQSARIFRQANSSYVFDISDQGIYILRLHFLPFSSSTENLSSAVFDVSVPGLPLLPSFSVASSTTSTTPIVKEFMLTINNTKFGVFFSPQASSFAFVNAIEVFLAPDFLIPDSAPSVSASGNSSDYSGIHSRVLQTKYRLNMGGPEINSSDDLLRRTWEQDDKYMISEADTLQDDREDFVPKYTENVTEYIAPVPVYQTAKIMNTTSSNTTWGFNVTVNSRHIVRAHFCDFLSIAIGNILFNLYIFDNFSQEIDPLEAYNIDQGEVPFKFDFAVLSDTFGKINVGIGSPNDPTPTAYINGLEVMEIMGDWNSNFIFNGDEGFDSRVLVIVGVVVGGFALLCILTFASIIILKYRKRKHTKTETADWLPLPAFVFGGGSSHSKTTDPSIKGSSLPHIQLGLKMPLLEIQSATNNFDARLIVGEGGFGNVYRGTLRNGEIVAVKRSKPGSGQGFSEFHTEITVLSKIRHRHLVSLIGFCAEKKEMILVYEFMEKGSLRDHLYNTDFPPLSWKQRLEICIGAAKGLNYLHKGAAGGGIIHRDVKSTNILLDANFVAKVADFGLSKSGPLDHSQTHVSTDVKGTFGYLDPEYFKTQQLTEKSDVYSFGVVLLEVLCARPAINPTLPREQMNLAEWGMHCIQEGMLEKIVDPKLAGQINPNSLRKFGEIAAKCLQEEDENRPIMADVLWDLNYALQLQQIAVQQRMNMESVSDSSSVINLSGMQIELCFSMSFVGDDVPLTADDSCNIMSTGEVFSQLITDEAR